VDGVTRKGYMTMHSDMTTRLFTLRATTILLAFGLTLSLGCGKEETERPKKNNTNVDAGDDVDPDGWENWNNPPDANGGFPVGCEPNQNLGVLNVGYKGSFTDLIREADGKATTCYTGQEESGHWLMTFRVAEQSIVDVFVVSPIGAHPFYQINEGICLTDDSMYCSQEPGHRFLAQPGTSYFVWVEKPVRVNELRFNVELGVEEFICWPGELSCESGAVTICHQGQEWRSVGLCATECRDESTCEGDECADAIEVVLGPGQSTVTISGDRQVYTNQWSAEAKPGCHLFKGELEEGEPDIGRSTPNGEVFFRVKGLKAGQTFSVEAVNEPGNYGFFILETCNADACLAAGSFDSFQLRRLQWEVPADRDYTVVVESMRDDRRPFEFVFAVTEQ
jgi:hypothetical protein